MAQKYHADEMDMLITFLALLTLYYELAMFSMLTAMRVGRILFS